MLDILEKAMQEGGYRYHRMDGTTPVSLRSRLVDDFNTNEEVFVFLLTTKVGGLGINLTGANRCCYMNDFGFITPIIRQLDSAAYH